MAERMMLVAVLIGFGFLVVVILAWFFHEAFKNHPADIDGGNLNIDPDTPLHVYNDQAEFNINASMAFRQTTKRKQIIQNQRAGYALKYIDMTGECDVVDKSIAW